MIKILGRYEKLRAWVPGTADYSPPFLLDRRHGAPPRMVPYGRGADAYEWDYLRERMSGRRGIFSRGEAYFNRFFNADSASAGTVALSSAYTANSAGAAMGARLSLSSGKTLDTVYYNIFSFTGTAANVNDINLELRADNGATLPDVSGAAIESKSHDPSATSGWKSVTGWTSALSAATKYWMIVADADGNGTDFATLTVRSSFSADTIVAYRWMQFQTTAGWASGNSSNTTNCPLIVLKFSDGSVFGSSITGNAGASANTESRGMRITTSALIANVDIFGVLWGTAAPNASALQIWTGDTGPTGTPDHSSTVWLHDNTGGRMGALISGGSNYRLTSATAYSIVAAYSASDAGGPVGRSIGTGADATLRKAMPGGGEFYWRRANGTTNWANDSQDQHTNMALLLDAQVAAAGGGGLLTHPGMSGGMRG